MTDHELLRQFHKLPERTQSLLHEFVGCTESMNSDEQSRAADFIMTAKAEGASTDSALEIAITAADGRKTDREVLEQVIVDHPELSDRLLQVVKVMVAGRRITA